MPQSHLWWSVNQKTSCPSSQTQSVKVLKFLFSAVMKSPTHPGITLMNAQKCHASSKNKHLFHPEPRGNGAASSKPRKANHSSESSINPRFETRSHWRSLWDWDFTSFFYHIPMQYPKMLWIHEWIIMKVKYKGGCFWEISAGAQQCQTLIEFLLREIVFYFSY